MEINKNISVTRVQSNGVVKVVLNIVTKNMNDFGYKIPGEQYGKSNQVNQPIITSLPSIPSMTGGVLGLMSASNASASSATYTSFNARQDEEKEDKNHGITPLQASSGLNTNQSATFKIVFSTIICLIGMCWEWCSATYSDTQCLQLNMI